MLASRQHGEKILYAVLLCATRKLKLIAAYRCIVFSYCLPWWPESVGGSAPAKARTEEKSSCRSTQATSNRSCSAHQKRPIEPGMLEQGCLTRPHASVFSLAAFLNAQPALYQAANRCWQRARPDPALEGPAAPGPTSQCSHERAHRAAFQGQAATAEQIE